MPGSAGVHAGGRHPQKRPSSPGAGRERGCRGWRSSFGGSILLDPFGSGSAHPGEPGAADAGPAAVVLVVGCDVPDRGVQPDRVVVALDAGELGVERGRIADLGQVRPVALGVGFTLHHFKRRLPAVVRVVAGEHPLSGRTLQARRVYRRFGRLWLVVELPDGGETSVEIAQTDLLVVETAAMTVDGKTVLSCEGARRLLGLLDACLARSAVHAAADDRRVR